MAITYVDATTYGGGRTTNTSSVVNTVPSGVADGDLLLWAFASNVVAQPSTPSGWQVWQTTVTSGSSSGLTVFYRIASSEPADYTVTVTSSAWLGLMAAWRGVDQTTPKDVTNSTKTATSVTTVPAITTATGGAMVVTFSNMRTASGVTNTTWSSATGTVRSQVTYGFPALPNQAAAIADELAAVAGSVTPTLTPTGTAARHEFVVSALRPAGTAIGILPRSAYRRNMHLLTR